MADNFFDTLEIYIPLKKGFDPDNAMDEIKKVADRPELDGVMMPFDSGVSIYLEEMPSDFDFESYKKDLNSDLFNVFGNQLGKVTFEF